MEIWSAEFGLMDIVKTLAFIHIFLSVGIYVCVFLFGAKLKSKMANVAEGERILLMTAHPDDECMFFSPFLLDMSELNMEVHVLCLTNGNYYSQGRVREKEILASCQILGIPPDHVTVINDSQIPDDPKASWDSQCLESYICAAVERVQPHQVVTFDDYGVSGHSNHITVSAAVRNLFNRGDRLKGVQSVLYLESISVWRKYLGLLELPFTFLSSSHIHLLSPAQVLRAQRSPARTLEGVTKLWAMLSHRSQLEWFRVVYIVLSRYMIANSFTLQSLTSHTGTEKEHI